MVYCDISFLRTLHEVKNDIINDREKKFTEYAL